MSKQRLEWLDVAKGGAIMLVVLHHAILMLGPVELAAPIYHKIDFLLRQARMPLFFLASGIATSFVIGLPRREFFARKLLPIAWIFLFWSLVLGIAFDGAANALPWAADGAIPYLLKALIKPSYGMWFVLALGLVTLAAMLFRDAPPYLILGLALLMTLHNDLGLWPRHFPIYPNWMVHNILNYSVFFFAGLYGRQLIIQGFTAPRRAVAALACAAAAFTILNLVGAESKPIFKMSQTLRALSGAMIGLGLSILISRTPVLGPALSWFGKRSLGVFVGHGLFLIPFIQLLPEALHGSDRLALLMPVVATAIAVTGSILLFLGLSRVGLRWLYILPPHVGRALLSWPRRVTADPNR